TMANTNGGAETIVFDSKVFSTPQTIALDPTLGQLELSDTTGTEMIVGPKAGVTASGGGDNRGFPVAGGRTAPIPAPAVTGGKAGGNGGGLFNNGGTLTLTDCTVSGNSATTAATSRGGGLYTLNGTTTLADCTVSGNTSSRRGGGLLCEFGTTTLTDCTFSGN